MIGFYCLTESASEKILEAEMEKQVEEEAKRAEEEAARREAEFRSLPPLHNGDFMWLEAPHFVGDGFLTYIEGVIQNFQDTSKDVLIEFSLFDENGNQVGTASDYIDGLGGWKTWKFSAIVMTDCASFEFSDLDAW